MSVSLYEASVGTFQRILGAVEGYLEKGRAHCEANGLDLDDIVRMRLIEDMLPFRFQVISVAHHSLGAIQGVEAGLFTPPKMSDLDFGGLQKLIADARGGLAEYSSETVDGFEDKDVTFRLGRNSLPFTGKSFLLSFSLPNFYFHATTAYDMLRMKGTPIGKRDFMGKLHP